MDFTWRLLRNFIVSTIEKCDLPGAISQILWQRDVRVRANPVCVWCCERRQKANNSRLGVTHTYTHSGQIRNNPPPASASFSGADKNSRSLLIDLRHTETTLGRWCVGIFPFDFLRPRTPTAGILYNAPPNICWFSDFPLFARREKVSPRCEAF